VGGGPDKKLPYLDLPSVALSVRDSVREERSRKQIRAVPDIPMSPRAAYGTGEAVPYARSPLHGTERICFRDRSSRTESLTDRGTDGRTRYGSFLSGSVGYGREK